MQRIFQQLHWTNNLNWSKEKKAFKWSSTVTRPTAWTTIIHRTLSVCPPLTSTSDLRYIRPSPSDTFNSFSSVTWNVRPHGSLGCSLFRWTRGLESTGSYEMLKQPSCFFVAAPFKLKYSECLLHRFGHISPKFSHDLFKLCWKEGDSRRSGSVKSMLTWRRGSCSSSSSSCCVGGRSGKENLINLGRIASLIPGK